MPTLVTGATGLIGNAICRKLVSQGETVRALVRDPARAGRVLPVQVELVQGDITDAESLPPALEGVELVYHAAGMPEQWQRDASIFDRINRQGTRNVLEAALWARVRRVVYTSTMDVFAAPTGGTLVEDNLDPEPKHTAYERSKQAAEKEAEALREMGLDVVFVNPGAVYGPSPVHVGLNSFFLRLLRKKAPMLPPGGMSVAYVDGVADAHIAAAERGRSGARYLVADQHVSNKELAEEIVRQSDLDKVPKVAPAWLMKTMAYGMAPVAWLFRFTPLLAPGQLSFLLWDVRVDASRAQRELGFRPTPLGEGVARTLAFLKKEGLA